LHKGGDISSVPIALTLLNKTWCVKYSMILLFWSNYCLTLWNLIRETPKKSRRPPSDTSSSLLVFSIIGLFKIRPTNFLMKLPGSSINPMF
jgi:hypothetical protein